MWEPFLQSILVGCGFLRGYSSLVVGGRLFADLRDGTNTGYWAFWQARLLQSGICGFWVVLFHQTCSCPGRPH
jgi:hypothetical protein